MRCYLGLRGCSNLLIMVHDDSCDSLNIFPLSASFSASLFYALSLSPCFSSTSPHKLYNLYNILFRFLYVHIVHKWQKVKCKIEIIFKVFYVLKEFFFR